MCSDGGGVNHPCPWPLAALISGERWSRTRSISNAAGNDTSPAPPGPQPRKGSTAEHSPSITASYCMLPPRFLALAGGLRGEEKNKTEREGLYFRFFLSPEKQQEDEEGQSGGFYLRSHLLVLYRRIIIPGLLVFVCLTQTHARCTAAHKRPNTNTCAVGRTNKVIFSAQACAN